MSEPANGHGVDHIATSESYSLQPDPELRSLALTLRALETQTNLLLSRASFGRARGFTFGGRRDVYGVLGYADTITTEDFRDRYQRGGLAGRIVDVFPNATWRGGMEIIEDESKEEYTKFEQLWVDFDKRLQVQPKFRRVDKLAGLSTFAVLLIGTRDGALEEELPRGNGTPAGIIYLTPFSGGGSSVNSVSTYARSIATGADATVFEYETDTKSPRFGLPKTYQLKRTELNTALTRPVHWSRITHVAEDLLDDEVFGLPRLERVWNDLDNLDKITGGGSEAFWLRANQGIHLDVDKDMALDATKDSVAALKEQMEDYKHQLTRALRTRGVKVETLGSDVANFGPNADSVMTIIAGSLAIPKRILTGSEMGELASSQDRDNWADQVNGRQTSYAGPHIVRQLVDRMIEYNYLPSPKKGKDAYEVRWPHIQTLTETEKATGAQQWASTNQTQGEVVFTDAEIRDKWYAMAPLTDEQRKEIADRAAEKMKQQQEAMAAAQPAGVPPETAKNAPPNRFKAAQEGKAYKFSSTQVQLPPALADALFAFGKSISAFKLCDEEGGLEDDAHVTVKYGLHTNDVSDVRKALATYVGPIRLTLGKTATFEAPEYDVLYVAVHSPDLVELNQRLSDRLEVTDTHPVYTPHATIAYLKKGLGLEFVGATNLEGMSASIGSVRFSPAEGQDVDLRITSRSDGGVFAAHDGRYAESASDEAILQTLTAAIEAGRSDVVAAIVGLGGAGSGNFGHAGRPGEIGGSSSDGGHTGDSIAEKLGLDKSHVDAAERKILANATTDAERQYSREMAVAEVIGGRSLENGDTKSRHTDADGFYTPERQALHNEVMAKILQEHEAKYGKPLPTELKNPVVTFMAGMPGAGKSFSARDLQNADALNIDPDHVKSFLTEFDKGLGSAVVARESGDIADKLMAYAADRRMNIIVDGTMKTSGTVMPSMGDGALGKMAQFKNLGYRVEARFVDASVDESVHNAVTRFGEGFRKEGISRYVPPSFSRSLADKTYGTKPRASFDLARNTQYRGKPLLDAYTHRRGYIAANPSESGAMIGSYGTITHGGAGK